MKILRLGGLAYSHYLDRFAVPCYHKRRIPGVEKGGIPTLWSFYPPWNQTPLYSLSTCGRAEGSREDSLHRMTEKTLTEHVRAVPDAVSLSLKWHQRIHAPCNSLSVILQWAPRALGTTSQILLSYESCPCQDTLCYAFFKKYLVYFFKLRLKYKSQSMGTEF